MAAAASSSSTAFLTCSWISDHQDSSSTIKNVCLFAQGEEMPICTVACNPTVSGNIRPCEFKANDQCSYALKMPIGQINDLAFQVIFQDELFKNDTPREPVALALSGIKEGFLYQLQIIANADNTHFTAILVDDVPPVVPEIIHEVLMHYIARIALLFQPILPPESFFGTAKGKALEALELGGLNEKEKTDKQLMLFLIDMAAHFMTKIRQIAKVDTEAYPKEAFIRHCLNNQEFLVELNGLCAELLNQLLSKQPEDLLPMQEQFSTVIINNLLPLIIIFLNGDANPLVKEATHQALCALTSRIHVIIEVLNTRPHYDDPKETLCPEKQQTVMQAFIRCQATLSQGEQAQLSSLLEIVNKGDNIEKGDLNANLLPIMNLQTKIIGFLAGNFF